MKVTSVTLTGINSHIPLRNLVAISEKFSYVEWGVLYNPELEGSHRHPTIDWINYVLNNKPEYMRVSVHLCRRGRLNFIESISNQPLFKNANRIQFNIPRYGFDKFLKKEYYNSNLPEYAKNNPVILAGHISSTLPENVMCLFDHSGGDGKVSTTYDSPLYRDKPTGYCGGISSSNVYIQLPLIEKAAGNVEVWLDSETGVMERNRLSLTKCIEFLNVIRPVIKRDREKSI